MTNTYEMLRQALDGITRWFVMLVFLLFDVSQRSDVHFRWSPFLAADICICDDNQNHDKFVVLTDRCVIITSHLVLAFPCDDDFMQLSHVVGIIAGRQMNRPPGYLLHWLPKVKVVVDL